MLINESEDELDPSVNNNESDILNDSQPLDLNTEVKLSMCGRNLNMTRPQFRTIMLLSTYYIISSSYYSLLAPFFPAEAQKKGLTETQIGIIFGLFELVLLILSPIFGKYVSKLFFFF